MSGILLDTELLPFAVVNVKPDGIKAATNSQKNLATKGDSPPKFSKVLNQQLQLAVKENGETLSSKIEKDKNIEEGQDAKFADIEDTLIKDVFNWLQYLINTLNVTGQMREGEQQSVGSQELVGVFQKEVGQLLQNFFQGKNLDIDKISQKISQLLEKNFGIKLQSDTIANAIKTGNFEEILSLYKNKNLDGEIAKVQESDMYVSRLQSSNAKEGKNNLTQVKEEDENLAQLNSQRLLSTVSKDNSTKSKNLPSNSNNEFFAIKKDGDFEQNQSLQQNDFAFLKHDTKIFDNQLIQQNSKYHQKPEIQIFDQIINNIILSKNEVSSTISIQLKPEFLGKLQINLKSIDGNIIATIITDSEKLKHQIESNLAILNSQLDLKGIKIDSFNVTVDKNMQFTSQYNGQQGFNDASKQQNMQKGYVNYLVYELPQTEEIDLPPQNYQISQDHIDVKA